MNAVTIRDEIYQLFIDGKSMEELSAIYERPSSDIQSIIRERALLYRAEQKLRNRGGLNRE